MNLMATATASAVLAFIYREEVGAAHGPEEDDGHDGEVGAVDDARDEDLVQLPAVWMRRWPHPVLGDGHDRACIFSSKASNKLHASACQWCHGVEYLDCSESV